MDINQLMQMAGQLKEQLGSAQQEASRTQVHGEAGGGLVKVTISGHHQVKAVHIDPSLLTADGQELLEDLVTAAFNKASEQLARVLKDRMGGLASGLGLDPSELGNLGG